MCNVVLLTSFFTDGVVLMTAMDLTRLSLSPTGTGAFGIATLGSNTLTAPYSMISPLTTIVSIIDTSVEREAAPTHGIVRDLDASIGEETHCSHPSAADMFQVNKSQARWHTLVKKHKSPGLSRKVENVHRIYPHLFHLTRHLFNFGTKVTVAFHRCAREQ